MCNLIAGFSDSYDLTGFSAGTQSLYSMSYIILILVAQFGQVYCFVDFRFSHKNRFLS